mmetsp:Transcript_35329/g.140415  ORF Transcript_35329/g.140415 Transcript_35329/m.140415 type:complete len:154 (+) Transcript_35329:4088-4549(+)
MYFLNNIRPCDRQDVVIPLKIMAMLRVSFTAKVWFFQFELLDHSSHCTIKEHDPLLQEMAQLLEDNWLRHSSRSLPLYRFPRQRKFLSRKTPNISLRRANACSSTALQFNSPAPSMIFVFLGRPPVPPRSMFLGHAVTKRLVAVGTEVLQIAP